METKQVIIIRKDLKMRLGKSCSQVAHASMKVLLDIAHKSIYGTKYTIRLSRVEPIYHWLNGAFTKVVVGCDSEEELLDIYKKAKEERIMCSLIQDAGRTEFHGELTYTAVAIGPDEVDKIDRITGHLKLL
jgi:PTH2 family peptidyl-tRNA hydrolase